ncbi:nucleoside-diphosphate kinase [Helicobacter mehlei]|uniref:Nucleoside diphosphate kinase n=1 Tax=Helicobacter mehlei TaxID=2316080 RepID=A0A553V0K9_9HELI|nr:nucleoside-diphosphate kinase [Helicobacter mehlei]TSA85993.1 nucleoside-diphosphate kinase [Helicobacter mehlei]
MMTRTLSIIKPDGVKKKIIGKIITRFEEAGLEVVKIKRMHLSVTQAQDFYAIHKDRPFFKDLIAFMTSGDVVVMVLEGEKAVEKNRKLMGATDPKKADPGTIRADFADNIDANVVHGSDSKENAQQEIAFFFGN